MEYLEYIDGKPLTFAPGSKYSYRNTNYLVLALIGDAITGDHRKFLSETIMKPLGLTNTFYQGDPGLPELPEPRKCLLGPAQRRRYRKRFGTAAEQRSRIDWRRWRCGKHLSTR
ncbi:MAG: serine hydrolase [Bacteroidota bacterium]